MYYAATVCNLVIPKAHFFGLRKSLLPLASQKHPDGMACNLVRALEPASIEMYLSYQTFSPYFYTALLHCHLYKPFREKLVRTR